MEVEEHKSFYLIWEVNEMEEVGKFRCFEVLGSFSLTKINLKGNVKHSLIASDDK